MSKAVWGKWIVFEGKLAILGEKGTTPIRMMIQLPYDWHKTHTNDHVRKHWAKRRKRKNA